MVWLERTFAAGALVALAALGSLAFLQSQTAAEPTPTGAVVWTKAVCDDGNFCADYEVTCENGKVVGLEKTRYSAQYDANWTDPRPNELKNWWC